ncbi:restriction endonuclease subunit S [Methanococcoides orientis]|uniref:restriction endonuclease subunit S n=1 Tax=Methanococcoides orientis TaxID=2822137 RepID=UPI001E3B0485|nr:restriction endonuclease subunit S [Methanococcoides orientis]UGV39824.1 restriction endonuclease subunit S [Methanococcoides orientis]
MNNNDSKSYPLIPIGELLETIIDYRGKTPPKSTSGIPVLTAANVRNGRVILDKCSYVSQETYDEWTTRGFPKPGDVLISTEAPVGEVASFPGDRTYLISRRLIALRGKEGELDNDFLKYSLLYTRNRDLLLASTRGSTVPRVLKTDITNLVIPIPPYHEQKLISQILNTFDEKIKLNKIMNQTLETMAQAIFKSWFVDFDPVKAKVNNENTESICRRLYLTPEMLALFPNSFEETAMGEMPKGWSMKTLADMIYLTRGKSYKSSELQDSDTALVTLKSFKRGGGYRPDGLKPYSGQYKSDQVVQPGELIVAQTDVTQKAEIIGKPALVRQDQLYSTLVASLDTVIVRPIEDRINIPFLYCLFRTNAFQAHTYGHSTGTTVLHLSKQAIPSYEFICPPKQLMDKFSIIVDSVITKIDANEQENKKLAAIRDLLLPKLFSGKIRVNSSEVV